MTDSELIKISYSLQFALSQRTDEQALAELRRASRVKLARDCEMREQDLWIESTDERIEDWMPDYRRAMITYYLKPLRAP